MPLSVHNPQLLPTNKNENVCNGFGCVCVTVCDDDTMKNNIYIFIDAFPSSRASSLTLSLFYALSLSLAVININDARMRDRINM